MRSVRVVFLMFFVSVSVWADLNGECLQGDMDACYRVALQLKNSGKTEVAEIYLKNLCDEKYRDSCRILEEVGKSPPASSATAVPPGSGTGKGRREIGGVQSTFNGGFETPMGLPEKETGRWRGHYENRRYGIAFDYPENVFTHKMIIPPGPDHGEEIKLKGRGSVELYVYSAVYDQKIGEVYGDIIRALTEEGSRITGKTLWRNSYFIKGVKHDGMTVFYKQAFFQDNIGIYMDFQYPVDVQERYESLVRQIVQRAHMTFPDRDTSTNSAASVVENRGPVLLYRDRRSYHLGDERIRGRAWARLHGRCLSFSFTGGGYRSYLLSLEKYGVESAVLYLNGQRLGYLPRQQNRRGKRRPNYWSRQEALRIPGNYVQGGSNRLRICSAPVANPEFPGDVDDMQIRDIQLFGE